MVFERDRALLHQKFPEFVLERFEPHMPLYYWLAGGLKRWTLIPGVLGPLGMACDKALAAWFPKSGSFVDVELVRGARV